MRSRALGDILAVVTALGIIGCAPRTAPKERLTLGIGAQEIVVEVARTDKERETGLMGRRSLGAREGMIFVFERDDHLTFWMKNTPLALSIAFLSAEGKILEIQDMVPFSETIIRSRFSSRYALEMRRGAFDALGIVTGDGVIFPPGFH